MSRSKKTTYSIQLLPAILIMKSGCSYSPHEVPFSALNRRPDLDKNSKPPADGRQTAIMRIADVTAVTAPDEHTVEVASKRPDPLLPMKLRRVAILSKAWADRH